MFVALLATVTNLWFLSNLQRGLAFVPVARAELVGLQSVEYAQNLFRTAAHRPCGDVYELNHAVGINNKRCALRSALNRIQNSQLSAQISLDVGEHGKRQVL